VEQTPEEGSKQRLPDALKAAIEKTFAATADSAAETRERAGGLLDEVSRRGQDARNSVVRRREAAGEASAGIAAKVVEAIEGMRLATHEELRSLEKRIDELSGRIADLETKE